MTRSPRPCRLYDFLPSGNGYKARLTLTRLRIPFAYQEVDILRGESRTPGFLAKNPKGEIPVLELEDGTCLTESNAIVWYLAHDTVLLPDQPLDQARTLQWMFFEQSNIDRVLGRARFRKRWPDVVPTTSEEFDRWYADGYRTLAVMEQHLEDRDFFVAGRYTAADICLFAYTHVADEGGFELGRFPRLQGWFDRVREQPGFVPIDRVPG